MDVRHKKLGHIFKGMGDDFLGKSISLVHRAKEFLAILVGFVGFLQRIQIQTLFLQFSWFSGIIQNNMPITLTMCCVLYAPGTIVEPFA